MTKREIKKLTARISELYSNIFNTLWPKEADQIRNEIVLLEQKLQNGWTPKIQKQGKRTRQTYRKLWLERTTRIIKKLF